MVIDCNASYGPWLFRPPCDDTVGDVWRTLQTAGVDQAYLASLHSVWCRDPHAPNLTLLTDTAARPETRPVPTLDPTVHTWRDHLALLGRAAEVKMVRLLPAYGPYELDEADEMLDECRRLGVAVQVQTRLDDPRRHHPRAMVPDVLAADILRIARRFPSLTVLIGGARFAELLGLTDQILELNLVYADTSQCDGMDALKVLCEAGLSDRLVYGSHAPLFEVSSGLRRVVDDLDDATAEKILGGNAQQMLKG